MLKVRLSLPVQDLAATEVFYAILFDTPPSKKKRDYLKFEPSHLGLNISFVPAPAGISPDTARHLGIQFLSPLELDVAHERLSAANLVSGQRTSSACCHANQDKFWVRDPNGYEWELYCFLSDADTMIQEGTNCCARENTPSCC